ncbi:uncharacterized protein FA14DRAFT_3820 [Meira miltonrushii]|uniref:Uncharacterized protein n=1 Tax=Meira miltonrushii TaxID=1280837 RepID=A0A316VJR2_9BASI|nr:uncharacterized protein FA14DRAFT_3820 [Meira miltonrushii]PWN36543.1 hypothetical protein FA14DRAFT_3820 [Meira miltonrushii]
MTTLPINKHLFQVLEEEREGEEISYESAKRPSTGLDSIKSASSAFSNQTWRINSTAGEFFDEQFSDSPSLTQGPLLLSNHPSTIKTQNLKELDSPGFGSTITQSTSAKSNTSGGTQTTQQTGDTSVTSADFATMSFPSPPNMTNADSPLMPIMAGFPITKGEFQSPDQNSDRQQRLAELRARQHALYLEQQALEMEKTPKQQYEPQFSSKSPSHKYSPPLDTDMQDGMNSTVKSRSSRRRLAPLPPQQALPPIPAPVAPLRVGKSSASETLKSPYQQEDAQQRNTEDIASDFEMASLRAQVAQLQLALKKQMNPAPQQIAGNKRGEPMDLYELSSMPLTPADSHCGSSERALSRAPSRARLAGQQSVGQHLMSPDFNNSTLDDFGRRLPESSLSPTQRDHYMSQQQRSINGASSMRSFNSGTQRYASSTLHRQASFQQSRDTFGNSFAMSTGSANSGTHSSRYGTNEPSLFSHRSMIPDETASSYSRPSTSDDRRVDELSAKIDRLEELLRSTALQPQSKPMYDEYSAALTQMQAMAQDGSHELELLRDSRYTEPRQHEVNKQERFPSQDENERNRSVESEVLVYPRMQQQGQNGGYARTPSLASSSTSQGGASTRTRSPASSAFQFNATPFTRGEQAGQKEVGAPSMRSVASMDSQNEEKTGTKADTHVEHIRRKGVARFILGSATTKLLDSHGGAVPSSQVSLSRNRTERIEKPKVKVKSAGRGRIVVKQPTKAA